MDSLEWLENWYHRHCEYDGAGWEHIYGIHLGTLDNPGWHLRIDLLYTEIEQKSFDPIKMERSDTDWIFCKVQKPIVPDKLSPLEVKCFFDGHCGAQNLREMIEIFRDWIEN
jgi:hypothetical protein